VQRPADDAAKHGEQDKHALLHGNDVPTGDFQHRRHNGHQGDEHPGKGDEQQGEQPLVAIFLPEKCADHRSAPPAA